MFSSAATPLPTDPVTDATSLLLGPPEVITDARCLLGESPVWDATHNRLHWVDTFCAQLHTLEPQTGQHHVLTLPEEVSCVVPHTPETVIVALRRRVAQLHLRTGRLLTLWDASLPPQVRFNDGKCDPLGRLLLGTMGEGSTPDTVCALYSLDPSGAVRTLTGGLRVSNGLTWSPDRSTCYHIDTPTRKVTAYDYDLPTGQLTRPRTAVRTAWPDGMTTDAAGRLWVAAWYGGRISVWSADGLPLGAVTVPAFHVTSCTFGGPDGTDLFITTARSGMTSEQLQAAPLSGALFRVRTRTAGLTTHAFGGPVHGGAA